MKLKDIDLLDLAMNNAYNILIGDKSMEEVINQDSEIILLPDPEITDEELSEDLIEYFISTEEYEKCSEIRDMIKFRKMVDNIINP
tara:strand:- start:2199 stop:2456 length:258 start_codon:yes stop_codon:yes gene_type:complete